MDKAYDVIIIGGGATGAGTARDCAMRGLKTLIVERLDFTEHDTLRPIRSQLKNVSRKI